MFKLVAISPDNSEVIIDDVVAYKVTTKAGVEDMINEVIDTSCLSEKGYADFLQKVIDDVLGFGGFWPDKESIIQSAKSVFKENAFERKTEIAFVKITDSVFFSEEDIGDMVQRAKHASEPIEQTVFNIIGSKVNLLDDESELDFIGILHDRLKNLDFEYSNGVTMENSKTNEIVLFDRDSFEYRATFDWCAKLKLKYTRTAIEVVEALSTHPETIVNLVCIIRNKLIEDKLHENDVN